MASTEYDLREADEWDEQRQTATDTICGFCGVGCQLTLHVQDDAIVKVTSPPDSPITHGNLCIKGRFGFQHAQRLPDPSVRQGSDP
jgi:predicted molibdopterin-dependent oxidoreductase YjgC